jgi:SAM-dependent methyltransferase
MSGFAHPLATWNARFAQSDYLFGREPNAFVAREAHRLPPGAQVLCVADGEGRNGVWLAERGCAVTAFDFAPNAVRKAQALAAERGVRLTQATGDIFGWDWDAARYDAVVAVFIQFLAPDERPSVFAGMRRAVRPGGLLLLEGYRPEQLAYGTGGPGKIEHLYTRAWLEAEFAGWDLLHLAEYDAEISEGAAHRGRSALIDLVARRPQ